ncbi:B-box type zinc finger protein ncl-1 [Halotydeus destructor]|nr:B-box type zinc finger protein ncl-1 [Halotydeus destructor]
MSHQLLQCPPDGHRGMSVTDSSDKDVMVDSPRDVMCPKHGDEVIKYFCRTCDSLTCEDCLVFDHPKALHDINDLSDITPKLIDQMSRLIDEGKVKAAEMNVTLKDIEHTTARLQHQYNKSQTEIADTFQFYVSLLEEMKAESLKELDDQYNTRLVTLTLLNSKVHDAIERMSQIAMFSERYRKCSSPTELLFFKQLIEGKLRMLLNFDPEMSKPNADLEFVSNFQGIRASVRNTFGYVRTGSSESKQPPISRPNNGLSTFQNSYQNGYDSILKSGRFSGMNNANNIEAASNANHGRSLSSASLADNITSLYEKWSLGGSSGSPDSSLFTHGTSTILEQLNNAFSSDPVFEMSGKMANGGCGGGGIGGPVLPLKSQIKRQKMIYHCKFGEFGVMEGQFTEPSGVAVNAQNDIIVADTNNHRIQIFDKEGRFKFQFGECGKRDGQLLYPNRVAVVKQSGDIIVTERSPTHQIQIYNQYGQFVRKFGANILQHPRGVTVDNKGRIIVVECKVMRVLIFDQMGNVLQKFGCSKHLEFPNGVVVNDKQEIFISDNRAHCVKVFSYEGHFLRQIGGEGLTNYPIGVCINEAGEILVADNHNNFNITIFTQDGQLISALESKVKHAQCFDVALMDDNSVVLASKDYRIYIYRYLSLPMSLPLSLTS